MTTSSQIYEAIRAMHRPQEWACFPDVANGMGGALRRRADAIAINLWPSRGLECRGFEIKVSRSDWQRELENPAKAETIGRFCHTWFVAAPKDVVRVEELPLAWGLMQLGPKGLYIARAAKPKSKREVLAPSMAFVAALARAAHQQVEGVTKEYVRRDSITDRLNERYEDGIKAAADHYPKLIARLEEKLAGARPILAALGIDLDASSYDEETKKYEWDRKIDADTGKYLARCLVVGKAVVERYGGVPVALASIDRVLLELKSIRSRLVPLLDVDETMDTQ